MLATTGPVAEPTMAAATGVAGQRQFKKHKVLPRPNDHPRRPALTSDLFSPPTTQLQPAPALVVDTSMSAVAERKSSQTSQTSRPQTLRTRAGKLSSGPELPPTPPAHSRTSSSSHSALPSSPTIADDDNLLRTPKASDRAPTTPPDQRSPPTPDVTPPQPPTRPMALHPSLASHGGSRAATVTTTESRSESFHTAREDPLSSEDDDGKSTVRPAAGSGRTSQTTVRRAPDSSVPHPHALDMALSRLASPPEDVYTPRTTEELARFDGDWGTPSDVEEEWDDNLNRNISVRKRQHAPAVAAARHPPAESRKALPLPADIPSAATAAPAPSAPKPALRHVSLNEKTSPKSSSRSTTDRGTLRSSSGPTYSDSSVTTNSQKRSSGISSKSFNARVEAYLIDNSPKPPQRQRTLRHVQKQSALREPVQQQPPPEPQAAPAPVVDRGRRPSRPPVTNQRPDHPRKDSVNSSMTVSSVSSARARRDVWKSGGIPVVVVPDRRSSRSKSREPSLRSTSSRRSRRTQSLGSAPIDLTPPRDSAPVFDRPSRSSRSYSLSLSLSSGDSLTMDYPPAIPARSSSLSAPTSRNTSRAGSMTADSLQAARDAARQAPPLPQLPSKEQTSTSPRSRPEMVASPPQVTSPPQLASPLQLPSMAHLEPPKSGMELDSRADGDRHDDHCSSPRKAPSRNTPFSVMSMETNGTAPEVSEAQAIHMYHHQNSSLLMVDHSARPSDVSNDARPDSGVFRLSSGPPMITRTGPDGNVPVTPPRGQFSLDDVESPLRNPRAPPEPPEQPAEPPAITFTSATPSGATPAVDKAAQIGNFFETMADVPGRRRTLVERAFSRRHRNTAAYPPNSSRSQGFLSRTFSLPRRRSSSRSRSSSSRSEYPQEDDIPPEEDKLHPFWRPMWADDDFFESGSDDDEDESGPWRRRRRNDHEGGDEYYLRYPPVDNRPPKPKRRLSDKMKRTFAILPSRDEDSYLEDDTYGTERRTIKRTPSGNLRVMRRRRNSASLVDDRDGDPSDPPFTALRDEDVRREQWQGASSTARTQAPGHRRRFSLSGPLEGIQDLPRRMSDRRREKRKQELRQMISGPVEVRDGVEDMLRSPYSTRRHTDWSHQ